jgi:hypothetical protein
MAIEELHNDVVAVPRFRRVRVVEEAVDPLAVAEARRAPRMNRWTPSTCATASGFCMSLRCCVTYAFASGLRKLESGTSIAGTCTVPSSSTTTSLLRRAPRSCADIIGGTITVSSAHISRPIFAIRMRTPLAGDPRGRADIKYMICVASVQGATRSRPDEE